MAKIMDEVVLNRFVTILGGLCVVALMGFGVAVSFDDRLAWILNVSIVLFGVVSGTTVGFLISPYESEEKSFSVYGKYILAVLSGYLASKFDRAIDAAVIAIAADKLAAFRMLAFCISFLAAVKVSFVIRRYEV